MSTLFAIAFACLLIASGILAWLLFVANRRWLRAEAELSRQRHESVERLRMIGSDTWELVKCPVCSWRGKMTSCFLDEQGKLCCPHHDEEQVWVVGAGRDVGGRVIDEPPVYGKPKGIRPRDLMMGAAAVRLVGVDVERTPPAALNALAEMAAYAVDAANRGELGVACPTSLPAPQS